jgi:hypothetical protein
MGTQYVSLPGRLSGPGIPRDVPCTVRAMKVTHSSLSDYVYARAFIYDEPANLPDGIYSVTFDHATLKVQRRGGVWVPRGGG